MTTNASPKPWADLLERRNALIGMVHVHALPGTPEHRTPVPEIIGRAVAEARRLEAAGFDAVIIENMHDAPYVHGPRLGPEITACMTAVAGAVRAAIGLPLGVQILSGGNTQALAVAQAAGGSFIRCENFVFSHVADEGLLAEAEAGPLLRHRRAIGADHVGIFCDIKKKHASHALTGDISIADAAEAAAFFRADALIVTGTHTGHPTRQSDIKNAAEASGLPVLVGSGASPDTLGELFEHASAVIVGSGLKADGHWQNPIDDARAAAHVAARDAISG